MRLLKIKFDNFFVTLIIRLYLTLYNGKPQLSTAFLGFLWNNGKEGGKWSLWNRIKTCSRS